MFKGLTKSKKQITIYTLAYHLQTVTANVGVHTSRKLKISFQIIWHNSFAVQGPKLWNSIPYHLNVIQDLDHFKDKLTKFILLSHPDKPISGYIPSKAVIAQRATLYLAMGWSEDVMAPSSLDETQHRSHG